MSESSVREELSDLIIWYIKFIVIEENIDIEK